jgi:pyruvate formate lyase activating enzyme
VAVTAGYVMPEPRAEFYSQMDAANVDLKGFSEDFYRRFCGGRLAPVLETLEYIHNETDVWLEVTTLLIPGLNDSTEDVARLTSWFVERLGPDVPLHFTAFRPKFKMLDRPSTPLETLTAARQIAIDSGIRYVYTGNVRDSAGQTTYCHDCGGPLIERDRYRLGRWNLDESGRCPTCGTGCVGVFDRAGPGSWGARRLPIRFAG